MDKLQQQYQHWNDKTLYLIPPVKMPKDKLILWKIKYDKKWYIENFLKIRDKAANLIPFKFNLAQDKIYLEWLKCMKTNIAPRFIVLKSRQQGISTWTEAMMFQDTANNSYKNTFIIAHEGSASSNLFNMSKLFYEELPAPIKPMRSRNNEKALIFENPDKAAIENGAPSGLRSKFAIGSANVSEAGRSGTNHNLHVSEAAFFPQAEKTVAALLQTIPDNLNTLCVLESTANGIGGFYHEKWVNANSGDKNNDFIPIFLPWSFDTTCVKPFRSHEEKEQLIKEVNQTFKDWKGEPTNTEEYYLMEEYNLSYEQVNWRRWAIANKCLGDTDIFKQEYPINDKEAFLSSGRPKFNIGVLRKYSTSTKEGIKGYVDGKLGSIVWRNDPYGYIERWEEPKSREQYFIGGDVAEGLKHGDYSCLYVMDNAFNIVAEWHGHIDPDLFGIEAVKLARYYNNAFVGIENNNHGMTTLKAMQRLEYWEIYYHKNVDKITDQMTTKMGWTTKSDTKRLMINKLSEFIREELIKMPSKELISELMSYIIEPNGSFNAQLGCYDDRVMALAICLQMALQGLGDSYRPESTNELKYIEDVPNKEVSI